MKLYAGIDLHSTNSYIGIIDENSRRVMGRRFPNDKGAILDALVPYKSEMAGVVVESTYNWYWIVDALMDKDYRVHLANPAAMKQYEGIKYLNDKHDAFWLSEMLKLGILPEGYIYPRESRGIRDFLRQRSRLVAKRTAFKYMLQQISSNQSGINLSNNKLERMKDADVVELFEEEEWVLHGRSLLEILQFLKQQIDKIERYVLAKMKRDWTYAGLQTVPGIGEVLGLTIALETGPIGRFASAGQYASYCRCVPSAYWSNGKKKGQGNQRSGNKYLSWAYAEAANFCIRFCPEAKKYYQRKMAKTNQPSAYRAMANKLSKACYFIMRDRSQFDVTKLFGG